MVTNSEFSLYLHHENIRVGKWANVCVEGIGYVFKTDNRLQNKQNLNVKGNRTIYPVCKIQTVFTSRTTFSIHCYERGGQEIEKIT